MISQVHMNWPLLPIAIVELISIIVTVRLWGRSDKSWPIKVWWTFVLLVPMLGLLFYGFISFSPSPHGENPIDSTGISRSGPGGLMN